MTTPRPDVTVVVVTYNGRDMALQTLRSAHAATGPARVQWIVVDSGSRDGTPDAIEAAFGDVEVVRAQNRGFAAANNIGIRRAAGRYILLLNPDVEFLHGTLAELVAAMDERPTVGLASVVQRGSAGELQHSIRRFPTVVRDLGESLFAARWPLGRTLQELETREDRYAVEQSVDWLVGAFLMARADAVWEIGEMDERFFLYSEEVDWCYRFHLSGWDVRHLPQLTILHHAGRRDGADLMAQLAYSRGLFARKHFGAVKSRGIRAALALGHLIRLLVHIPASPFAASSRARLRAESSALAVQLGMAGPPRLGAAAPAVERALAPQTSS